MHETSSATHSIHAIASAIAPNQLGLFASRQLYAKGVTPPALRSYLRNHRCAKVRPGVFRVAGAPVHELERLMAAVLAGGDNVFVSHACAARVWPLPIPDRVPDDIELTWIIERRSRLIGVRSHSSGLLRDSDITTFDHIPITSPERTIAELTERLSVSELANAIDEALRQRITTPGRIWRCATTLPAAPGRVPTKLQRAMANRLPGTEFNESILEDFVYDAIRRHGLRMPRPQFWIELEGLRFRIDLAYPERRVFIEALGFGPRLNRTKFDNDATRQNALVRAGWRPLVFTSNDTDHDIAVAVADMLGVDRPRRLPDGPLSFQRWTTLHAVREIPTL